eukprot:1721000-Prymnesium_polylepis.1
MVLYPTAEVSTGNELHGDATVVEDGQGGRRQDTHSCSCDNSGTLVDAATADCGKVTENGERERGH